MVAHSEEEPKVLDKTIKLTSNNNTASKPHAHLIQSKSPHSPVTSDRAKRRTSSEKKVRRRIRRMKNGVPGEVFEEATKDWYTLSACQLTPEASSNGKRERFSERARRLKGVSVPDNSEKLTYSNPSKPVPLRRTNSSPVSRKRIFIRNPSERILPKSDDEGDDLLLEESSQFVTPNPSPRGVLRRSSSSPRLLLHESDQAHMACVKRFYSKLNLLVSDISEGSNQKNVKESPRVSDSSETDDEEKANEENLLENVEVKKKADAKKTRKKTKSSSKRSSTKKQSSFNHKSRARKASKREASGSPRHANENFQYFL